MNKGRKILLAIVLFQLVIWLASEWWEKALATRKYAKVSPDECFRLEKYRPFWVLPNALHSQSHPEPEEGVWPFWRFPEWDDPAFYRLYDQHTGTLLGETDVYDVGNLSGADLGVFWGGGKVSLGPLTIADVRDHPCMKK
jgi:hypothetical protein